MAGEIGGERMSTKMGIPEGQQDRKDFKDWQVVAAFMAQEGVCSCGNPLEHGFHRHHRNEDHTDSSVENLELKCPECHRATLKGEKKEALDKHRSYEQEIFKKLNEAIDQTLQGKLSGASAERLLDAISLGLKMSHQGNHVDEDIEHVPLPIKMAYKTAEREIVIEAYTEGFKDCLKSLRIQTSAGPFGGESKDGEKLDQNAA